MIFSPLLGSKTFDSSKAGKKAAHLHELIGHGLNVPRGFVVSFDMDLDSFSAGTWDELIGQIGGFPVAVRSSATLEDLEGASFAGQYQSFLDVETLPELLEKIEACRASNETEQVRSYLRQKGLDTNSSQVSTLIQKMVPAQMAGVGFSIHPLTGREDHALIEFCAGLGEKLVSGRTEPSHIVLSLKDGKILEQHLGSDGVSLSEPQARELRDLLLEVQAFYGAPQDIEWAFDSSGLLYLLQSRPITRIQWRSDVEEFTNADLKDGGVSARVCTPLMYSLYRNAMSTSMQEYGESIGIIPRGSPPERWIDLFYGRPYWNASAVKRSLSKIPGFSEDKFDLDLGIQKQYSALGPLRVPTNLRTLIPAIPIALALEKNYKQRLKLVETFGNQFTGERDRFLAKISNFNTTNDGTFFSDLLDVIGRFHLWTETNYFKTIYNNSNAQSDFKNLLGKMDKATRGETSIVRLLGGLTDIAHMNMQRGIVRLYRVAQGHGFDGDTWKLELSHFLKENYFHSDAELDLSVPRWGETPDQIQSLIEKMLSSNTEPSDPDQTARPQRKAFEDEVKQIEARLGARFFWKLLYLARFRKQLNRVRTYLSRRESMREFSTQAYFIIRLFILEAGRRFAKLGWIGDSNDVFMLKTEEIVTLVTQQGGQLVCPYEELIRYRKKMYQGYRSFIPPNELGKGVLQRSEESYLQNEDGKTILKGLGCSPGKIEGQVRIVHDLNEMHLIQKGDILVTRFTDPGWTPVLGLVSGIITEVGGLLSHAAVIGREYGIPAVLNLPGATKALTSGQRVRVDGSTGRVELMPSSGAL